MTSVFLMLSLANFDHICNYNCHLQNICPDVYMFSLWKVNCQECSDAAILF
jgi:hypothetical protein